ncbi:unnamed protein product [Pylaiella littoralis]
MNRPSRFDIESLLTPVPTPRGTGFWDDENGAGGQEEFYATSREEDDSSALPRALEHVFSWLREVEAGHQSCRASGVDETIFDTGALLAVRAPSSTASRDNDKVVLSKAVTKADFCLASRDQPSIAIGLYAQRVVCRSKWLFWSDWYAEYLVVTGTETELLRAWRTYSDFYSLARTVRTLGARRAVKCWNRLDQAQAQRRRTDPSSLRTEIRLLGRFLTTVLEELDHSEVGILADFVREPTTYVVVGVEDIEGSSNADTCGEFGRGGEATAIAPKAPESCFGETGSNTSRGLSSPGGAMFGAEIKHPMAWQMTAFSLKPAPRIWDGL